MKRKRRDERIVQVATLELAKKIKEQCCKTFITYDLSNVCVYKDKVVTGENTWVKFHCLKDEWQKIEEFYNLKRVHNANSLSRTYEIGTKVES